jgi:hypothetical protein
MNDASKRLTLVAVVATSLLACAPPQQIASSTPTYSLAYSLPMGAPAAPHDPGCHVDFQRLTPKQAQDRWEQGGVVCVSIGNETLDSIMATGLLHEAVRQKACALGTEIVVPVGLCGDSGGRGIEFGAFRLRAAGAAAGAPTTTP